MHLNDPPSDDPSGGLAADPLEKPEGIPRSDYDSPWKLILDRYLREALRSLFPEIERAIDWSAGFEVLDTELQRIRPDADTGRRHVDKLVKVRLRSGQPALLLLHIEVQGDPVVEFPKRMFGYNTRLLHLHPHPVVSLAILADDDPSWHPGPYQTEHLGCTHHFSYPTVKLIDLPEDDTLFGHVIAAYRAARQTRKDPEARAKVKLQLTLRLYDLGYTPEQVRDLYTFIDWVLQLPLDLERDFQDHLIDFEKERRVQYVTSAERIGIEKGFKRGLEQGLDEGLERGRRVGEGHIVVRLLQARFGDLPGWVADRVEAASTDQIERWAERILVARNLEEVFEEPAA